ncbi:MAG: RPA family protein [Halobacteriaceae archaeon]
MSSNEDGPASGREVAYRLFAAEFDDADFSHSESDEERAPNYVVTPTGARVNRLFAVGVLTEVEQVGEDVLRARVVDPTGAFVVYAGQYQPDAMAFLDDATTPAFVAVTGKARTFQPEDSDRVFTSVRPESVSEVDAETRDRWVVHTAEQTLDRVATMADALDRPERGDDLRAVLDDAGVPEGLAAGVPLAIAHYDTTEAYLEALRTLALDAVEVVTGDRDEAGELALAPDEGGAAEADLSFSGLGEASPTDHAPEAETAVESAVEETDAEAGSSGTEMESELEGERADATAAETDVEAGAEVEAGPESGTETETDEAESEPEEYELPEEEREAVIEEHGVEFSTGTEVPDAGEADIETPDVEEVAEDAEDAGEDAETADEAADADVAEEDLQDLVVEYMTEMGDGGGVPRGDLVAAVTEDYDVSAEAVEDAVQDALMAGQCYESGDDELTPI